MKYLLLFFLAHPIVLNAQLNIYESYKNRQLDFIESECDTSCYNYLLVFSCYCDGCIAGTNRETFFFVCDNEEKVLFKRIGLYSDSKVIDYNAFKLIDFFLSNDSLLQNEEIDNSFFLIHKSWEYIIRIYSRNQLVYEREIARANLNKNRDTALSKFIQLLRGEIFDISISYPFEYNVLQIPLKKQKKIE